MWLLSLPTSSVRSVLCFSYLQLYYLYTPRRTIHVYIQVLQQCFYHDYFCFLIKWTVNSFIHVPSLSLCICYCNFGLFTSLFSAIFGGQTDDIQTIDDSEYWMTKDSKIKPHRFTILSKCECQMRQISSHFGRRQYFPLWSNVLSTLVIDQIVIAGNITRFDSVFWGIDLDSKASCHTEPAWRSNTELCDISLYFQSVAHHFTRPIIYFDKLLAISLVDYFFIQIQVDHFWNLSIVLKRIQYHQSVAAIHNTLVRCLNVIKMCSIV